MIFGHHFYRHIQGYRYKTCFNNFHQYIRKYTTEYTTRIVYKDDVSEAKLNGTPIIALESTIITHGMPYPDNLETALEVEDIIRKKVNL